MKPQWPLLLLLLLSAACKKQTAYLQPHVPAKYSVKIKLKPVESQPSEEGREEAFRLLTEHAKACGIVCQSIETDPRREQITFNIIGQLSGEAIQDPGLEYYSSALTAASTLEFWDLYRNTDAGVRTMLLKFYERPDFGPRLSLNVSFNSPEETPSAVLAYAKEGNRPFLDSLFRTPEFMQQLPADMILAWSSQPIEINPQDKARYYELYALKKGEAGGPFLSGRDVDSLSLIAGEATDEPSIALSFTRQASRLWAEKTQWAASNGYREIGIVVDGRVLTAPRVSNKIPDGNCVITGGFTMEESKKLIDRLKLGALPYTLKVGSAIAL